MSVIPGHIAFLGPKPGGSATVRHPSAELRLGLSGINCGWTMGGEAARSILCQVEPLCHPRWIVEKALGCNLLKTLVGPAGLEPATR